MKTDQSTNGPGVQSAVRGRIFKEPQRIGFFLLASVTLLMTLASMGQGQPLLSVEYDTHPAGENLQSAYLLRERAAQPWVPGPRPPLQAHFDDVLRILQCDAERSLRTALARLEAAQGASWPSGERETKQQRLAAERKRNIAVLREYQARGLFPVNDVDPDRAIPIFVDRQNTACAVGYLMRRSGAGQAVEAVVQANNLVYVTDVHSGPLVNWVLTSGLTQEEAALIQPGYTPSLGWHTIEPPLENDLQIIHLVFSSFSSEFVADPEHQEDGYGTSAYSVAVAPDSWGNDLPGGDSGLLANFPIHIGVEGATWSWPDPLVRSSESGDTGHFKTYEFMISPAEFEGFNQLAVATQGYFFGNRVGLESTNGRIQIAVRVYDPEDRLIGELSFDSTVPGETYTNAYDRAIYMSAEDAVEFLPTSSIRVVTAIRVWGQASVYSLAYGLNPIEPKFQHEIIDDSVTVTGFSRIAPGVVTVPSEIDGLPVTRFDPSFLYGPNVTAIVLPASLASIGDWYVFDGFPGLESIIVAPENTTFASLNGVLFDASFSSLIRYPRGKTGPYSIPDGIASIGDGAFRRCDYLDSVTLPGTVADIGDQAFDACVSLTGVTIPGSVTRIGAGAFRSCRALADVTIGSSVTSIGDSAFDTCTSLTNIIIPDSVTWMGRNVFATCVRLTSATIGTGITNIGSFAFARCNNLKRVYFEGNVPTTVGGDLFFYVDPNPTIYYLPWVMGWGTTFGGAPAVMWNPHIVTDDEAFGIQAGKFGFTIVGVADVPVAIEACSDPANPDWTTITNLTCGVDGTVQFFDPEAANHPTRIYRFRPE